MAIILGGTMVPATSLVQEKQDRTITAVTTTSASLGEMFAAKALLGVLLSLVMGVVILVINRAFGTQPLLLVGLLALGAIMAALIGVLMGAFIKDINTLFATVKGLGILLYAPGLHLSLPGSLPQWIGRRHLPHLLHDRPDHGRDAAGRELGRFRLDTAILAVLDLALIGALAALTRRARRRPAMLPGLVS
jgi:MFS family permease